MRTMRRPQPLPARLAVLLLLLLPAAVLPGAAAAQDAGAAPPPPPAEWSAGFRLGLFDMINAADSYDAIYGDPMPQIGGQVERARGRLRFALSLDYGMVDGERVLLTGGGVRGTGIDEELVLAPLHLTAAWRFNPAARWEWSAGLGPSLLYWSTDSIGGGDSGSDFGGSVVTGVRRRGAAWDLGGELRWSTFPGALDDTGGVTRFYDEDDPGGLALTFLALRRF
jgi:hypothetical protein